jgi:UDP-N-acetylmuramate: L-alanyl-gamma-D-glutamyl-meso-diaminopimelate ligase
LSESSFFVIEADEYDSAFFDKRSKFVHYRPRTVILNNLEFDHADIFPDLDAIKKQFHHLVRTIPSEGLIISPACDANINEVLTMGCWTPSVHTSINASAAWNARLHKADGSRFSVSFEGSEQGTVNWSLTGEHNVYNALSAIVAAKHIGILPSDAIKALAEFKNVKRRMEVIAHINNVTVYDDFAHHPTAIQTTLDGLRKQVGAERIIAIVEPRSNTMRLGTHNDTLAQSFTNADLAIIYQPSNLNWDLSTLCQQANNIVICTSLDDIIARLQAEAPLGGHFVIMSNGSFGGLYQLLQTSLMR